MIDPKVISAKLQAGITDDGSYLVGVGKSPEAAGWTGGQSGQGVYKPYVTLIFAGASPWGAQTLSDYQVDWQVNFTLRSFAAGYDQLMDVRAAWGETLDGYVKDRDQVGTPAQQYRIAGLRWLNLGPAVPDRTRTPTHWSSQDSVGLLVGKAS